MRAQRAGGSRDRGDGDKEEDEQPRTKAGVEKLRTGGERETNTANRRPRQRVGGAASSITGRPGI